MPILVILKGHNVVNAENTLNSHNHLYFAYFPKNLKQVA